MSDIKLFQLTNGMATELNGHASDLEKPLQTLIERNLDPLLSIRFLATEYSTGKTHAGRIDTLGLDENFSPVIVEYKRSVGENVINQGLFYLDWLLDHQAEFKLLVMEALGNEAAARIDWTSPRLLCIAADFTKYDIHAVQQINRNVELIRYRRFGSDLLLLELASATSASYKTRSVKPAKAKVEPAQIKPANGDKSYTEWLSILPAPMLELLTSLENFIASLGDDIQRKELKLYVAFKRLKNFATIVPQKSRLLLFLHLNPDSLESLPANARDARLFGHWGTGDLELAIGNFADMEQCKGLILNAYEGRGGSAVNLPV